MTVFYFKGGTTNQLNRTFNAVYGDKLAREKYVKCSSQSGKTNGTRCQEQPLYDRQYKGAMSYGSMQTVP